MPAAARATKGTMPAALTLLTDKESSSARPISVLAVYMRTLSGLIVRTCSAPAKRLCQHVRLAASALPPGAALRRHLYLGLSPLEPGVFAIKLAHPPCS